jgi:hypothetical protein
VDDVLRPIVAAGLQKKANSSTKSDRSAAGETGSGAWNRGTPSTSPRSYEDRKTHPPSKRKAQLSVEGDSRMV